MLNDLSFSDAEIQKIELNQNHVLVTVKDWQEQIIVLQFDDIFGIEAISHEGEELSHAGTSTEDREREEKAGKNEKTGWKSESGRN